MGANNTRGANDVKGGRYRHGGSSVIFDQELWPMEREARSWGHGAAPLLKGSMFGGRNKKNKTEGALPVEINTPINSLIQNLLKKGSGSH